MAFQVRYRVVLELTSRRLPVRSQQHKSLETGSYPFHRDWESGIQTDIFLTFPSHSTLKDEKFVSGLTSVLECAFSRELKIMCINAYAFFLFPGFLEATKGRWEQGLLCPAGQKNLSISVSCWPPSPFYRPTSYQLVRKSESGDDCFLWASRTSRSFIHCWCSGPYH